MFKDYYNSPIGLLEVIADSKNILEINLVKDIDIINSNSLTNKCIKQLDEYFDNKIKVFNLNLLPKGTEFQKKIWTELLKIPYGKTVSYKDIANAIINPKAVRAVGTAIGKNPIPIIIPCHRVIGSNGKLSGFALGLDIKQYLLDLEK